eukprot:3283855-Pleurochrysis_carterae.AAC.1
MDDESARWRSINLYSEMEKPWAKVNQGRRRGPWHVNPDKPVNARSLSCAAAFLSAWMAGACVYASLRWMTARGGLRALHFLECLWTAVISVSRAEV